MLDTSKIYLKQEKTDLITYRGVFDLMKYANDTKWIKQMNFFRFASEVHWKLMTIILEGREQVRLRARELREAD